MPFPFAETELACKVKTPRACSASASTRLVMSAWAASRTASAGRCHLIAEPSPETSKRPVSSKTREKPAAVRYPLTSVVPYTMSEPSSSPSGGGAGPSSVSLQSADDALDTGRSPIGSSDSSAPPNTS